MKSFNKLILGGIVASFSILVTISILLFLEYRFFTYQSQEMLYLQEQYRKAISLVLEAVESAPEIDEKKKSLILNLMQ